MKINKILVVVIIGILFTSCTSEVDKSVNLERYTNVQETVSHKDYLSSIGNGWLTQEIKFDYDIAYDSIRGVQKLGSGNLGMNQTYKNRIYFTTVGEQGTLYMYLDPSTGEVFNLCPDPLCSHTDRDKCPYMTVTNLIPDNSTENGKLYMSHDIIFDEGYSTYCVISEIMEDGSLRRVYGDRNIKTEEGYTVRNSFDNCFCVYNNYLCFIERYDYRSKTDLVETKEYFRVIDGDTGEQIYTCDRDEITGNLVNVTANHLLFRDYTEKCYYITDLQMNNRRNVLTYTDTVSVTYDKNTSEYICYITENDEDGNKVSSIYVYDDDWNGYKLEMPSEQITYAVITQNYIYYEKYHDPVVYGISIRDNRQTVDTTGNKIFRVKRPEKGQTAAGDEELVFDGHGEIFSYGFNVLGDYIYMKYKELHHEGSYVWWRITGDVCRINITDSTIKWINIK